MSKQILGKHIGFITAHPDDEALLAGGTIYKNKILGGKNFLYCATLGERGTSYLKNIPSVDEIKELRKQELFEVGNFLGVDIIEHGHFPDKAMDEYVLEIRDSIAIFIATHDPEVLISFGDDGFTGHTDHVVLGKIVKDLAKELNIPFFTFSKPPRSLYSDFDDHLLKKRKQGVYAESFLEYKIPDINISIDPVKKLAALELYKSQFEGLDPYRIFPKDIADHILSNEYFIEE